jgi:hypothetical protein
MTNLGQLILSTIYSTTSVYIPLGSHLKAARWLPWTSNEHRIVRRKRESSLVRREALLVPCSRHKPAIGYLSKLNVVWSLVPSLPNGVHRYVEYVFRRACLPLDAGEHVRQSLGVPALVYPRSRHISIAWLFGYSTVTSSLEARNAG